MSTMPPKEAKEEINNRSEDQKKLDYIESQAEDAEGHKMSACEVLEEAMQLAVDDVQDYLARMDEDVKACRVDISYAPHPSKQSIEALANQMAKAQVYEELFDLAQKLCNRLSSVVEDRNDVTRRLEAAQEEVEKTTAERNRLRAKVDSAPFLDT